MTLEQQAQKLREQLKDRLLKGAFLLENEMHELVAIDTGELDESINTHDFQQNKDGISIKVGVDPTLANDGRGIYVEYGSDGVAKNYHRNGRVVYTGLGMQFVSRSLANKRGDILRILRNGGGVSFSQSSDPRI